MANQERYDVVILGAGLAGLTLARHLLLDTDKTVLLLEKRSEIPPKRQKVGESSVQVAGFYYSKVLDLEEYLFHHQFMKYNLRFYWKSSGRDNSRFEDYGHSYIRTFSNVASYQLDRNTFEGEVLRRNQEDPRFTFRTSVAGLDVTLNEAETPHQVGYKVGDQAFAATADWVVDTTGRGKFLARRRKMERPNSIRHGSFFWWVDGLVNIDKLTDRPMSEIRRKPERRQIGHLPFWLATNHFCDEGLWFWVIPLQGKTSLGLVYDNQLIPHSDVFSVEKATKWVCERFPCFAHDLPHREVLDFGGYKDFSYDCVQTINSSRWAMAGEAGRFTDPLYSPGSDLISIYNTLIVDSIKTDDPELLRSKCQTYEQVMKAVYQAYVPSYAVSYDALGDQETFSLKYTWELTIYFAFYVFPFLNDFFTDRRFLMSFLRLFSKLGPMNATVQKLLSDYFQWKKVHRLQPEEPVFFDFTSIGSLQAAEKTFYEMGVSVDQAKQILNRQKDNLDELARFVYAQVTSNVLQDRRVLTNRKFIESIDVNDMVFDPEAMRQAYAEVADDPQTFDWTFDPFIMDAFRTAARAAVEEDKAVAGG